jgi:hypothetical protein
LFEKKELHERDGQSSQQSPKLNEEIESIRYRLYQLRDRVARLKLDCEEFRTATPKTKLEQKESTDCNSCGRALDPREGVVVKNSDGTARACYHAECFRALLSPSLPDEQCHKRGRRRKKTGA